MRSTSRLFGSISLIILLFVALSAPTLDAAPALQATLGLAFSTSGVRDGTAPFDGGLGNTNGYDENDTNNVVRTLDTITYGVEVQVSNNPDTNVNFRAQFPAGVEVTLPSVCVSDGGGPIDPDSSISGDSSSGWTIICNIGDRTTGQYEINFEAVVLPELTTGATDGFANGEVVTATFDNLTADAAVNSPGAITDDTTVSAGPRYDLRLDLGSISNGIGTRTTTSATPGEVMRVPVTLQIEESSGRGAEPLASPFTATFDLTNISPNARLYDGGEYGDFTNGGASEGCGINGQVITVEGGSSTQGIGDIPNGTGGGVRDVTDSGTWACSVSGTDVTLTITGADTSGIHTPTLNRGGGGSAQPGLVATGWILVWVPHSDIGSGNPGDSGSFELDLFDFDPDSISGVSNFATTCGVAGDEEPPDPVGAGCEPIGNNERTFTLEVPTAGNGAGSARDKNIVAYPYNSGQLPGSGSVPEGSRVVVPTQIVVAEIGVTITDDQRGIENFILCDKIDTNYFAVVQDTLPRAGGFEFDDGITATNVANTAQDGAINWASNFRVEYTSDPWGSLEDDNCESGSWDPDPATANGSAGQPITDPDTGGSLLRFPNITGVRVIGLNSTYDFGISPANLNTTASFRAFINLQIRDDSPLYMGAPPNGEELCNYWTYRFDRDGTFGAGNQDLVWRGDGTDEGSLDQPAFDCPNYTNTRYGERIIISQAVARIDKYVGDTGTDEVRTVIAGNTEFFRLDPTLSQTVVLPIQPASTLQIIDTLPDGLTYVTNSAYRDDGFMTPFEPTVTPLGGGVTQLTWDFGTVNVGDPIDDIIFEVTVEGFVVDGTDLDNSAEIVASLDDVSTVSQRTDDATITVANAAAYVISKAVTTPFINPNDSVTYELRYNNTGSTVVTQVDAIDILPNTTDPLPPTSFVGQYTFVSVLSDQASNVDYYVTTRTPQNDINLDGGDASNDLTTGSTVWCRFDATTDPGTGPITVIAGGNPSCGATVVREDVTAVRVLDRNSFPQTDPQRVITLIVDSENNDDGNIYTNEFGTRPGGLVLFTRSIDVTVEVVLNDISGFVYEDTNGNGVRDTGEPGIPNVTVQLTGTDNLGNIVDETVMTDSTGFYEFADQRAPDVNGYTITETQPSGYGDGDETAGTTGGDTTVNDVISGVGLPPGTDSQNNNFGETSTALLTINKTTTTPSTTPGGTGVYEIVVTNDGSATAVSVEVSDTIDASVFTYTTGGTNATITSVTNTSGNTNFTIGDIADGDEDFTSPTLSLFGSGSFNLGAGDSLTIQVTVGVRTDAAAGTYDNDAAVSDSAGNTETDDGTVNDDGGTGSDTEDDEDITINLFSLSGFVYADNDNSGDRDPAFDSPIAGVTLDLTGTDIDGNSVNLSTTTDANGFYEFTNLVPPNGSGYTVTQTQPTGYDDGSETAGSTGGDISVNDVISAIPLPNSSTDNNFGELGAAIQGFVWQDADADGLYEPGDGEAPIFGVPIGLYDPSDLVNPIATTTTSSVPINYAGNTYPAGSYLFPGVAAGEYVIIEDHGSGSPIEFWESTFDADTAAGTGSESDYNQISLTGADAITAGEIREDQDFADRLQGVISGFVYIDSNLNGNNDTPPDTPPDVVVPNVTVTLFRNDGAGYVEIDSTTTDANGFYSFEDLPDGDYQVVFDEADSDIPAGVELRDNSSETVSSLIIDAPNGLISEEAHFPLRRPPALVTTKTNDDDNGIVTPGQAVRFTVTVENVGGNRARNFTVTDTLPTGWSYVSGSSQINGGAVSNPTISNQDLTWVVNDVLGSLLGLEGGQSFTLSYEATAPDPATGSDPYVNNARVDALTRDGDPVIKDASSLVPADSDPDDADSNTLSPPAAIQGFIWDDRDADGIYEPSDPDDPEAPITGVTVELYDSSNNLVATTTTSTTPIVFNGVTYPVGSYLFTELPVGDYTVIEVHDPPIEFWESTFDADTGTGGTEADRNTIAVTGLSAGEVREDQDFADRIAGRVEGFVYVDPDLDGDNNTVPDSDSDSIVPGVRVELYDEDGNLVATTTTDSTGFYQFDRLPDDNYRVIVNPDDLPPGTTPTPGSTLNFFPARVSARTGSPVAEAHFPIQQPPALVVTKTNNDDNGIIEPGQIVTFTAVVENVGGGGAQDIVFIDTLPLGWSYIQNSSRLNGAQLNNPLVNGQELTWDINALVIGNPSISTGESLTLLYQAQAPSTFTTTEYTNVVRVNALDLFGEPVTKDQSVPVPADTDPDDSDSTTLTPPAAIEGFVWQDNDEDGVYDPGDGEAPIIGVTIELYDASGTNLLDTTTTSATPFMYNGVEYAAGSYLFTDLQPGDYVVRENHAATDSPIETWESTFDADTPAGTGSEADRNEIAVNGLIAGELRNDQDFADRPLGFIEGFVYLDPDADGSNATEPDADGDSGIENVTVTLFRFDGGEYVQFGDPIETDSTGFYRFPNLPDGTYRVVADDEDDDVPGGANFTPGASDTVSDLVIDINGGQPSAEAHFPLLIPAALVVTKTNNDDNGVLEPGQIVTFTITVENVGGDTAQNFTVTDILPTGWSYVGNSQLDGNGIADPDISGQTLTWEINSVTLGADEAWTLTFEAQAPDSLEQSTYTNTVIIDAEDPDGDSIVKDGSPSNADDTDPDDSDSTTLGVTAAIEGFVWTDFDADGMYDIADGEEALTGITIELYDSTGTTLLDTTTTSTTNVSYQGVTYPPGTYLFTDLQPGSYIVREVHSGTIATWESTFDADTAAGTGSEAQRNEIAVDDLSAGELRNDQDFADRPLGILEGFVYLDPDADGSNSTEPDADGDSGIEAVTVTLYRFDGSEYVQFGDPIETDSTGFFQFTNLPDGTYRVIANDEDADIPALTQFTPGAGDTVSDLVVDTAGGGDVPEAHFPFLPLPALILDESFDDVTGAVTPGQEVTYIIEVENVGPGLAQNFDVTDLLPPNWTYVPGSSTFNDSSIGDPAQSTIGDQLQLVWDLDALVDPDPTLDTNESFTITFVARASDPLGDAPFINTASVIANDILGNPVTLDNSSALPEDIDPDDLDQSELYPGARIEGTVWNDIDADGVFDDDEDPIPGVLIELYSADDPVNPLRTTTTDDNGDYVFDDVAPGEYIIRESQTGPILNWESTFDADTGTGGSEDDRNVISLTGGSAIVSGETRTGQDFADRLAGKIQGFVYVDPNGDGIDNTVSKGPGDTGIQGAFVTLRDSSGAVVATTTTDDLGYYLFDNLPDDTYTVSISPSQVRDAAGDANLTFTPGSADEIEGGLTVVASSGVIPEAHFPFRGVESLVIEKEAYDLNGGVLEAGDAVAWIVCVANPDSLPAPSITVTDNIDTDKLALVSGSIVAGVRETCPQSPTEAAALGLGGVSDTNNISVTFDDVPSGSYVVLYFETTVKDPGLWASGGGWLSLLSVFLLQLLTAPRSRKLRFGLAALLVAVLMVGVFSFGGQALSQRDSQADTQEEQTDDESSETTSDESSDSSEDSSESESARNRGGSSESDNSNDGEAADEAASPEQNDDSDGSGSDSGGDSSGSRGGINDQEDVPTEVEPTEPPPTEPPQPTEINVGSDRGSGSDTTTPDATDPSAVIVTAEATDGAATPTPEATDETDAEATAVGTAELTPAVTIEATVELTPEVTAEPIIILPGTVSGRIYHDANASLHQEGDEDGIADVTITLYVDDGDGEFDTDNDSEIASQTTDEDGNYTFADLEAGDYWLFVDEDTLPDDFVDVAALGNLGGQNPAMVEVFAEEGEFVAAEATESADEDTDDGDERTPDDAVFAYALDTDGDSAPDGLEGTGDRDNDDIPNYLDAFDPSGVFYIDLTGNAIADVESTLYADMDGDGVLDLRGADDLADTVQENPQNSDADGAYRFDIRVTDPRLPGIPNDGSTRRFFLVISDNLPENIVFPSTLVTDSGVYTAELADDGQIVETSIAPNPPITDATHRFFLAFDLSQDDDPVVNNHVAFTADDINLDLQIANTASASRSDLDEVVSDSETLPLLSLLDFTLTPNNYALLNAGETKDPPYPHVLINTGEQSDSYLISFPQGSQGWPQQLNIYDSGGNLLATLTWDGTEPEGSDPLTFITPVIEPGDFFTIEHVITVPVGTPDGTIDATTITATSQTEPDLIRTVTDLTETVSGCVEGTIYNDTNQNGIQDADEPGIGGVRVFVFGNGAAEFSAQQIDGDPIATLITAGDGTFDLGGLSEGSYIFEVDTSTLPAGTPLFVDPDNPTQVLNVTLGSDCSFGDYGLVLFDPGIAKAGDPSEADIGEIIDFTITVTNDSTAAITGVTVVDPLVSFLDFVSAETPQGSFSYDEASNTVTFNLGTLQPGEIVVLTVTTQVNESAPSPGMITNTATLDYIEGDPQTAQDETPIIDDGDDGGGDSGDSSSDGSGDDDDDDDSSDGGSDDDDDDDSGDGGSGGGASSPPTTTSGGSGTPPTQVASASVPPSAGGGAAPAAVEVVGFPAELPATGEPISVWAIIGSVLTTIGTFIALALVLVVLFRKWIINSLRGKLGRLIGLVLVIGGISVTVGLGTFGALVLLTDQTVPADDVAVSEAQTQTEDVAVGELPIPDGVEIVEVTREKDAQTESVVTNETVEGEPQQISLGDWSAQFSTPNTPATHIHIPALDIDTALVTSPIEEGIWDVTGFKDEIAHLEGTAHVGTAGNAVLAGHVTHALGLGPFRDLHRLKEGDIIRAYAEDGAVEYRYVVRFVRNVQPAEIEYAHPTIEPGKFLTLITCSGWDQTTQTYNERVVVRAEVLET